MSVKRQGVNLVQKIPSKAKNLTTLICFVQSNVKSQSSALASASVTFNCTLVVTLTAITWLECRK